METPASSDSGSVNVPNWVLVLGFAMFAVVAGWVIFTLGSRGSGEKALLEAALRQYQEQAQDERQPTAKSESPLVASAPPSSKVAMGAYAPDRPTTTTRPGSPPPTGPISPANPFEGGNALRMPATLEGNVPVLPQPDTGAREEPPPAPPVDDRAELLVYLVSTLDPTENRQTLADSALAQGGFAQNFTDFFGEDRIVQADAVVLYVPRSRVETLNAEVRKLGGRLEDQWRGAQRDRQAELEGPQRRLLQKLLADRSALLRDFEEDAPVVQELDVIIDRVRDSFRSLRPSRDTRGLAAIRVTLMDSGG